MKVKWQNSEKSYDIVYNNTFINLYFKTLQFYKDKIKAFNIFDKDNPLLIVLFVLQIIQRNLMSNTTS